MRSRRLSDVVGWVVLSLVVTVGLALVVTPSTAAPVAQGTLVHDRATPTLEAPQASASGEDVAIVRAARAQARIVLDYLAKNPRRIA